MSTPIKALVVGSGSSARRHLNNLRSLLPDAEVGCVSASGRRLTDGETVANTQFSSLDAALGWAPRIGLADGLMAMADWLRAAPPDLLQRYRAPWHGL